MCAIDFDNMHDIREQNRDAHRNHSRIIADQLLASGAILDEDGANIIGGFSIIDTDDYTEAEEFVLTDPYQKVQIKQDVKILR
ncbi:MAG: YciI family protein [Alphaproteobacteria bacterium]|nr:YciI family protein [Alphaproteobacteria bacterium]